MDANHEQHRVRQLSRDASESLKLSSSTPAARHIDGTTVSEEGAQVLRTVKPDACTLSELSCSEPLITETAIHIFEEEQRYSQGLVTLVRRALRERRTHRVLFARCHHQIFRDEQFGCSWLSSREPLCSGGRSASERSLDSLCEGPTWKLFARRSPEDSWFRPLESPTRSKPTPNFETVDVCSRSEEQSLSLSLSNSTETTTKQLEESNQFRQRNTLKRHETTTDKTKRNKVKQCKTAKKREKHNLTQHNATQNNNQTQPNTTRKRQTQPKTK